MNIKTPLTLSFIFLFHLAFSQQVKVALIGDFGAAVLGPTYEINEGAVADLIKSWDQPSDPLDAILTVGDNNYPDGLQADIETNVGQFYGEYIEGHPDFLGGDNRFIPAIGNHDYGTSDCNLPGTPEPHLNYYNLPGNELYFDYVIGNVHFFVLDSDCHQPAGASIFSEQADWLEATMTNSNAPWKIVYFHHAPYTSGPGNDGVGTLRWDFKAWGATAVIGGHYHYYERLEVDGLAYFVNGAGGTDLHTLNPPIPGSQVLYNEKHGAMQMTFSATEANFKFINIDNETIDDYTILLNDDCENQGGDSDGDGICDNQDCQPNDPNFPTSPGTSCDDQNENTENDVIQPDGCTCEGTPIQTSDCNEIDGFVKLGEFNKHGYFLAENNSAGWENAQSQCLALDGYLVSIENQAEKDFIDPFISGEGDQRVFYIGLSRNQNDDFVWTSDGSLFNENNYDTSPWEGGSVPSAGNFTTLRKWNPSANVNWGTEGGNAYRKFILEKNCSTSINDCENQGGDSDGDGICDNQDCQPNDPNFPTSPGTSCDDQNENTENDVIQPDGCTCEGTPILSNSPCDEVTVTPSSNSLTIENINVPIAIVKIYDSSWSLVFECNNDCPPTITQTNLSGDTYHVEFHLLNAMWENICSEIIHITLPENLINFNSNNSLTKNNAAVNTFTNDKNEIIIYPNPVSDILFIKNITKNNSSLSIQILDSTGKVILKTPINFIDKSTVEIPIHELPPGLFFLILENKNGIVKVKRVVKK